MKEYWELGEGLFAGINIFSIWVFYLIFYYDPIYKISWWVFCRIFRILILRKDKVQFRVYARVVNFCLVYSFGLFDI